MRIHEALLSCDQNSTPSDCEKNQEHQTGNKTQHHQTETENQHHQTENINQHHQTENKHHHHQTENKNQHHETENKTSHHSTETNNLHASSALFICVQILSLVQHCVCCVLKACPRPEPDDASWQMWQMEPDALAFHLASQSVHRNVRMDQQPEWREHKVAHPIRFRNFLLHAHK